MVAAITRPLAVAARETAAQQRQLAWLLRRRRRWRLLAQGRRRRRLLARPPALVRPRRRWPQPERLLLARLRRRLLVLRTQRRQRAWLHAWRLLTRRNAIRRIFSAPRHRCPHCASRAEGRSAARVQQDSHCSRQRGRRARQAHKKGRDMGSDRGVSVHFERHCVAVHVQLKDMRACAS